MHFTSTSWAWPWWSTIVFINVINVCICIKFLFCTKYETYGKETRYVNTMRLMGVIFTAVAAYRSVFVSCYFTQMTWFDNLANSPLLIRNFAFFAENSLAGLFALAMLHANKDLGIKVKPNDFWLIKLFTTKSPYFFWSCIFIAQFFAYGGLLTKYDILFAIEESLWSLAFLAISPLAFLQLKKVAEVRIRDPKKNWSLLSAFTKINMLWCVVYCSYGVFFHLPLEVWPTAFDQMYSGLPLIKPLNLAAFKDAFFILHESKTWNDWGFGFIFWHSSYFTVTVWIALFLMRAPRILNKREIPNQH